MSDDVEDRVNHAQEQNRHVNVQSDVSIGMEGDGDSGALSKSRDMLREHNELASDASEQMLQQDDAMIDDEIRSGNEGVAEDVLNNGLEQADKQNQLPSEPEGSQPESASEQSVPEQSQPEPTPEPTGEAAQPDNAGIELLKRGAPAAAAESALQNSSGPRYKEVDHYSSEFMGVNDDGSKNYIGWKRADLEPISPESTPTTPTSEPTTEPVAPAPTPEPDVNGRSDYLMRQSERIEQHANIADATANKGDRNMMRQGVLHQMDKRTLVHDTGMVSRLQGCAKTNMLTHNNKLAADIRDSARTQSKLTAIYSKTHKNAGEAYRKANKLRQAAQQLKLQHAPKPVTPGPVKPKSVDPNKPKSVEPKKLEPKKDNPQTETPKEDFGPHIPQNLGTPKTFKKPAPKPKPKSKPNPKDKSASKHGKSDKEKADEIFNEAANSVNSLWSTILKPQIIVPSIVAPFAGHKASFESKDKSDAKSNARLAALNERLDDGKRASHQVSNGVSYC